MNGASVVGIIANPASARDIRRLVAHGGALTTHDKLNQLQRLIAGLTAGGVDRIISMSDASGIASGLQRLAGLASNRAWPPLEFINQKITHTKADTTTATEAMVTAGVDVIVVLGGDGTNGVVAASSGDVPLVSISTGTNNAFPQPIEPTVAGIVAGLVATSEPCRRAGTYRAKRLILEHRGRVEQALVDVAVSASDGVGSGAIWDASLVSELFLSFAEPDAIGLSAIGGHAQPTPRRSREGLRLMLGEPAQTTVRPPIAPGLVTEVAIRSLSVLEPDVPVEVAAPTGVVALDGERILRFGPEDRPTVSLRSTGPTVVDVKATLAWAATNNLLATQSNSSNPSVSSAPSDAAGSTNEPLPQRFDAWEVSQCNH